LGGGDIEDSEVCDLAGDDFGFAVFGFGAGFGGGVISVCGGVGCAFATCGFAALAVFGLAAAGFGDMSVTDIAGCDVAGFFPLIGGFGGGDIDCGTAA
jgi:hypothetical protein